jgi:two-component system, NarL family, response regulator NreC
MPSKPMEKIRLLIADHHAILRAGLRMLINAQPDMEVVGEAVDGPETLRQVAELAPDVLTLEVVLPGMSGIKVIEQLQEQSARTRVLVLTMHDDPALLRAVLTAGGAGFVVKKAPEHEVMAAIRTVHQGRTYANVSLEEKLSGSQAQAGGPVHSLAPRELEVLQWLVQGETNKEIAAKLFLSVKTVETYRARIMEKLGLRSRAELVRYAFATGLLVQSPRPETKDT